MSESVKEFLKGKGLLAELEGCRNGEEAINVLKRENLWGIINYPELEELKKSYKNGEVEADGTLSLSQLDMVAGGVGKGLKAKRAEKRKERSSEIATITNAQVNRFAETSLLFREETEGSEIGEFFEAAESEAGIEERTPGNETVEKAPFIKEPVAKSNEEAEEHATENLVINAQKPVHVEEENHEEPVKQEERSNEEAEIIQVPVVKVKAEEQSQELEKPAQERVHIEEEKQEEPVKQEERPYEEAEEKQVPVVEVKEEKVFQREDEFNSSKIEDKVTIIGKEPFEIMEKNKSYEEKEPDKKFIVEEELYENSEKVKLDETDTYKIVNSETGEITEYQAEEITQEQQSMCRDIARQGILSKEVLKRAIQLDGAFYVKKLAEAVKEGDSLHINHYTSLVRNRANGSMVMKGGGPEEYQYLRLQQVIENLRSIKESKSTIKDYRVLDSLIENLEKSASVFYGVEEIEILAREVIDEFMDVNFRRVSSKTVPKFEDVFRIMKFVNALTSYFTSLPFNASCKRFEEFIFNGLFRVFVQYLTEKNTTNNKFLAELFNHQPASTLKTVDVQKDAEIVFKSIKGKLEKIFKGLDEKAHIFGFLARNFIKFNKNANLLSTIKTFFADAEVHCKQNIPFFQRTPSNFISLYDKKTPYFGVKPKDAFRKKDIREWLDFFEQEIKLTIQTGFNPSLFKNCQSYRNKVEKLVSEAVYGIDNSKFYRKLAINIFASSSYNVSLYDVAVKCRLLKDIESENPIAALNFISAVLEDREVSKRLVPMFDEDILFKYLEYMKIYMKQGIPSDFGSLRSGMFNITKNKTDLIKYVCYIACLPTEAIKIVNTREEKPLYMTIARDIIIDAFRNDRASIDLEAVELLSKACKIIDKEDEMSDDERGRLDEVCKNIIDGKYTEVDTMGKLLDERKEPLSGIYEKIRPWLLFYCKNERFKIMPRNGLELINNINLYLLPYCNGKPAIYH